MMSNRDKNWKKYIDPRIVELQADGYHLEAFYLCLTTIEYLLQSAIELQEEWIAQILTHTKLAFNKTKPGKLKDMTLGQLISLFSKYCDDKMLISQLNQANSTRKKIVHKLLDYSIEKLNEEARNNFKTYLILVKKIYIYMIWLQKKKQRSLKYQIRNIKNRLKTKKQDKK